MSRYHHYRKCIEAVSAGEYDPYQLQAELENALALGTIDGMEYDNLMVLLGEWM